MSVWPPPPPTALGRYRVLSPLAGIRVSSLQLGAANIGDNWAAIGYGETDKESMTVVVTMVKSFTPISIIFFMS